MAFFRKPAIIIDNGSNYLKIGFEGDDFPLSNIPNVAGVSIFNGPFGVLTGACFVGYEVIGEEADYLWHPIRECKLNSWESLEYIYNHFLYRTLDVDPREHAFVILDAPFGSFESRVTLSEIMYERYGVPALSICDQGAASVRFSGRESGLVVDIGASGCNVTPVCNGRSFRRCAERTKVGGDLVTHVLMTYMNWRNYEFRSLKEILSADEMKCNFCYVADDFWKTFAKDVKEGRSTTAVRCCDGSVVYVGEERYISGESMFKPTWASVDSQGIHEAVVSAINGSPAAMQDVLVDNIVLCGGGSLLQGLPERLDQELSRLRGLAGCNVITLPQREVAAWTGGSILATEMKNTGGYITREQFQEYGPNIVRNASI